MIKLLRYLRKKDWILLLGIIGLTILQVYCTMTLMDYVSNITTSIQYVYYHNHPGDLIPSFTGGDVEAFWSAVLASPLATSQMIAVAKASIGDIWFNGGMMILVSLGMIACQALISVMAAYICSSFSTSVRKDLNDNITSYSLAEINRFSIASLVTRTTNDVQMYQMFVLFALRMFFAAPVTAIWAIVKINKVDWTLMLPTLIGIIALVVGLIVLMVVVLPKFKISQTLLDRVNARTRENVSGIRVVRAYNGEDYQEEKFEKTNKDLTENQLFTGRAMALMSPYITIIMNVVSLLVYWIGANLINDGKTDYSQVLSMMMLSTQIVMAFMMLLMMFILLPRAKVSAIRIEEILHTKASIKDPDNEEIATETGTLKFDDVSFKYPDGDNDVISHISFSVKKGETIAFIGETGSGKSSILNLIPRLYDVTSGVIYVDGVDVRKMKQKTLRSLIGYVPQKGLLFTGSVKSNIAFGNDSLGEEEIIKAAKVAEADEFILKMPGGYEGMIAQGGTNVSGGQRQRLCIARAAAINPQFYLFDDSFSALDFKTDKKVRDNLKIYAKDATKVIVAQRIGTIMDADHIVFLADGKMIGYGTHQELLNSCEVYRNIALSQLSKEELGL